MNKLKANAKTSREARSRLPNLLTATVDVSDDLVMAIDELLNPTEQLKKSKSWRASRLCFLLCVKIIQRLSELQQPDMVSDSLASLQSYLSATADLKPDSYYSEFMTLLQLMSTRDSNKAALATSLLRIGLAEKVDPNRAAMQD